MAEFIVNRSPEHIINISLSHWYAAPQLRIQSDCNPKFCFHFRMCVFIYKHFTCTWMYWEKIEIPASILAATSNTQTWSNCLHYKILYRRLSRGIYVLLCAHTYALQWYALEWWLICVNIHNPNDACLSNEHDSHKLKKVNANLWTSYKSPTRAK